MGNYLRSHTAFRIVAFAILILNLQFGIGPQSGATDMDAGCKRIIIVDDSEIYRAGLRALINGHDQLRVVAEAECGDKAIEAIKKIPADLVLLDLSLPKYTGFEVLRRIREISDINVLVLTIYESQEMITRAKALGAQGYCVKDVSRKELIKSILEAAAGKFFVCHKSEMVLIFEDSTKPPQSET
ncbi:MAG: response regulator transcription factor [Deltaproteobacteria bacterium]|nr:response regulator transcription factor [Deltaproteobacteria bacterium]